MAQDFIYHMKGLKKSTPDGKEILRGIWLSFFYGAKIGVIGPNGAGKSTLLRVMAGLDQEFEGEVWLEQGMRVGYLAQEPTLDSTLDVRGNIELGLRSLRDLLVEYDQINAKFGEEMDGDAMDALIQRQSEVQDKIDAANAWELDRMVDIAMDALRVPDGAASVENLSGGERRRVALCRLLLSKPDLLLLDEPTNHLDAETVAWLERTLRDYEGTVIVVTHDRYFLDNVTKWILELENGKGLPYEGNYSGWLDQKLQRLTQDAKEDSARAKALEQELAWVKMGLKERHAKNASRLREYDQLLQRASQNEKMEIVIPPGPRLGDIVVEADHLSKGYGQRLLIDNFSFKLPRGGIVGVIGANGAGKTTMFRMIAGEETPDSGSMTVGDTVKIASVAQTRHLLDDDKTVWECITGGSESMLIGGRQMNSRAYVSAFGFRGSKQQQKVGTLSGGERNRVHLGMILQLESNLLLLDEPTNDLDVTTLRALESGLESFAGCAVIISHDRWFMDRVATHILAFEGNSEVFWFEGNYQEYEADRKRRLGKEADQPHQLKYKPLRR